MAKNKRFQKSRRTRQMFECILWFEFDQDGRSVQFQRIVSLPFAPFNGLTLELAGDVGEADEWLIDDIIYDVHQGLFIAPLDIGPLGDNEDMDWVIKHYKATGWRVVRDKLT